MITLYGISNCNKIRDTRKWLEEREVPFSFVDLKKAPISGQELEELAGKVGLDTLVNRKGMKWRQLGLSRRELDEEELFSLLLEHQVMIKRPLLTKGEAVLVGYDEDSFEDFIG